MQKKARNSILGIPIKKQSKQEVLEEIKKYISRHTGFCHIVSLNPENMVIANELNSFRKIIMTAQITIIDGIGVVMAAQMLNVPIGERVTGVEMMGDLMDLAERMRLRVLLIGGRQNLALSLSKCYQDKYPEAKLRGIMGLKDVRNPTEIEEKEIISIVRQDKPHLILVAFGSPWQELWIERHKKLFTGIVCMGVGQGFDVAGGLVKRAPRWMQQIGIEWLYRLVTQPWRWKRQLRLLKFAWLVMRERLSY